MKGLWMAALALPLCAEWSFVGSSRWREIGDAESPYLEIEKAGPVPEKPVRRPAGIALLPDIAEGDFEFQVEAESLDLQKKGADVCIIFGYQNEENFYYAHISNDSNNRVHTVIMKVEGATRSAIQMDKDPPAALRPGWQTIRLRRGRDGEILIFVGDGDKPHLSARDKTWLSGRVGVGSFDDRARFRQARLRPLPAPAAPPVVP